MADEITVVRRHVRILNALGLHLRAADKFVRQAQSYQAEVRVTYAGVTVNGKSILDLATLAAVCGVTIEIEARGPDAEQATAALAGLVAACFHETEGDEGT
ncbi:MAG: HPr family phosphocarrier protein [Myxococcaceae bacterium]